MTCPEKLAAALLAAAEARDRPVVETRDSKGRGMLGVVKPPSAEPKRSWEVVSWGKRKSGRPKKKIQTGLKEEDQKRLKLERAINKAITHDPRRRSIRAITNCIIADKQLGYCHVAFDTLYKRVKAAVEQRGTSFWHYYELHELSGGEPSAELLRELGLQSLQYLERPFGTRIVED